MRPASLRRSGSSRSSRPDRVSWCSSGCARRGRALDRAIRIADEEGKAIPTIDELLATARARLDRLTPTEAREAVDAGALIVDTRCTEARVAKGTIPGSVHIPLSVLFWRLDPTSGHDDKAVSDRERRIIVVCADGYSSSLAAATLLDLGFSRATDLAGGFAAWAAAGLPVERPPGNTQPDRVAEAR